MDMWKETNWFAVQAKPFRESSAALSVSKVDAEVFFPRIREARLVCGVSRDMIKPLFPGYFFAKFCPLLSLDTVRYAAGVLRVVGTACLPIAIDEQIILAIRARIETDGFIRLTRRSFQPGDRVLVEAGPFQGSLAEFEQEWDDGKRVAILLDAISKARVLIEARWLAPAVAG